MSTMLSLNTDVKTFDIVTIDCSEIDLVGAGANWAGVASGVGHIAGGGVLVVAGAGIAGGSGGLLGVAGGVVAGFGAAGIFFGVCEVADALAS